MQVMEVSRALVTIAAAIGMLAGCAAPLMHPLRASNGPYAEEALSFGVNIGRHGSCDNFEGCVDSDEGGGGVFNMPQFGAGYSRVFRGHFGIMGGAYLPAWENIKQGDLHAGIALTSFFTVQNDYASFGVGPELGVGGVAGVIGGEVQPWGMENWRPRVGVYTRRFYPFFPNDREFDNRVATWEVGGRLRVGPIFLGYDHYMQDEGAMYWTVFETASYAQGHHIITLGMTIDMDTVKALKSKHRY